MKTEPTWTTFITSHLVWIVAAVILYFSFRAYQAQHDSLVAAEAQAKADETTIAGLNKQIVARDGQITSLQAQQVARDKQTQAQIAAIAKLVNQPKTPEQVVQALPVVTSVPLNAHTIPNSPQLAVDAEPLFAGFAACKEQSLELATCQADLSDEKKVAAALTQDKADDKAIIAGKDDEIKKFGKAAGKKGFWGKVWEKTEQVGLVVIGVAVGKAL